MYSRDPEHLEHGGELGVTVPDEEPERADPATDVHQQVPRLLRRPSAVRVGRYAEDVHPAGRYLHDEQHVQALEEDRVHGEEVTRQQALGLSPFTNRAPSGARPAIVPMTPGPALPSSGPSVA